MASGVAARLLHRVAPSFQTSAHRLLERLDLLGRLSLGLLLGLLCSLLLGPLLGPASSSGTRDGANSRTGAGVTGDRADHRAPAAPRAAPPTAAPLVAESVFAWAAFAAESESAFGAAGSIVLCSPAQA